MRTLLTLLLPAILLLASCNAEGDETDGDAPPTTTSAPASPSPTGTDRADLPPGWARCVDEAEDYSIGHPEGWQVDAPELEDRCRLFDPEPFDVEPGTEHPVTAMMVRLTPRSFERARAGITDSPRHRLISSTPTQVDGSDALRFERVQTEDLLYPEGTMEYGYLVDHDGRTMLVTTLSFPGRDGDYEDNKEVVDQAVETLELGI